MHLHPWRWEETQERLLEWFNKYPVVVHSVVDTRVVLARVSFESIVPAGYRLSTSSIRCACHHMSLRSVLYLPIIGFSNDARASGRIVFVCYTKTKI